MRRHQLLLLTDGVEKAERVHAETEHPDECQGEQRRARGKSGAHALARAGRSEDQEREHEARRDLDPHPCRQRPRGRAWTRVHAPGARTDTGTYAGADAGTEKQGGCERQQQQRVVVCPADGQHQEHRVQPNECGCPAWRLPEPLSRAGDQRDRTQARGDGYRLERPQPAREAQGRDRVAEQREQRAVGGVLKRPADEPEDRVSRSFGCKVRVGIQAVQRPEACEREVAEHVLGDQRRAEEQDHVGQHDRHDERTYVQRSRRQEHE